MLLCFCKYRYWYFLLDNLYTHIPFPVYSYNIYRKHKKEGVDYTYQPKSKAEKAASRISAVVVLLILIGVAFLMFTGDITVSYGETAVSIDATFWAESEIDYDSINAIEYVESGFEGYRINGFASAKLSLGQFQNEDFGQYISYVYNSCEACVVIYGEGNILILNGPDTASTKAIYDTLIAKIK